MGVVGGRLSEGINFTDELGRCVMVVGMPYPNIKDPLLQEKFKYLQNAQSDKTLPQLQPAELAEIMCMKAVNQSIGRSIRHRNDRSIILLIDERYKRLPIQAKLPFWIAETLTTHEKFHSAFKDISRFYRPANK